MSSKSHTAQSFRVSTLMMVLAFSAGCVSEAKVISTPIAKAESGRQLQVAEPTPVLYAKSLQFHSRVAGTNSVNLSFPSPGRVETLNVVEGQSVNAGDVLATLDAPHLYGALDQAKSAVESAKADMELIQLEFDRAATLHKRRILSTQDYTAIKRDHQVAQQRLKEARTSIAQVQNNLNDLRLVAAETGLITRIHSRPGGYLQAGEPLLRLDSVGQQNAAFDVPENVAVQMTPGDRFELFIPALNRLVTARVVEKSPPANGSLPLHRVTLQLLEADVSLVGLRTTFRFKGEATLAQEVDYRAIRYGSTQQPYIVEATDPLRTRAVTVLSVKDSSAIFTTASDLRHGLVIGSDFTLPLNLALSEFENP